MTTNTATEALLHKGSGLQVVVGLGQSGLSVAHYLAKQGYQNNLCATRVGRIMI